MTTRKFQYRIIFLDTYKRQVDHIDFEATSMDAAVKVYLREAKKNLGGYIAGFLLERVK